VKNLARIGISSKVYPISIKRIKLIEALNSMALYLATMHNSSPYAKLLMNIRSFLMIKLGKP
jgi:hypothetical protein